jgi:hypothetical protein
MSTEKNPLKNSVKRDLSEGTEASVENDDDISQPDIKRSRVETSTTSSSDLYLDTVSNFYILFPFFNLPSFFFFSR